MSLTGGATVVIGFQIKICLSFCFFRETFLTAERDERRPYSQGSKSIALDPAFLDFSICQVCEVIVRQFKELGFLAVLSC